MVERQYAMLTLEFSEFPTLGGKGAEFQTKRKRRVRQISENESTTLSHTRGLFVPGRVQDTLYLHGFPTVLPRHAMSHQTLRSTWVVMV